MCMGLGNPLVCDYLDKKQRMFTIAVKLCALILAIPGEKQFIFFVHLHLVLMLRNIPYLSVIDCIIDHLLTYLLKLHIFVKDLWLC